MPKKAPAKAAVPTKKAAPKKTTPTKKKAAAKKAASKSGDAAFNRFKESFGKTFGAESLVSANEIKPYKVISTGSPLVDVAMGVGGYVEGRLVEIWSPDGLGKTTFSLVGMVEALKAYPNKRGGFIDVERTFDKGLAEGVGVPLDRFDIFPPDSAEDVADAMKMMVQSGFYKMIILDSIGAMIPEAEKEKDADEVVVALQAKIVTRMVKIAAVEAAKHGVVVIMINQVRANVGGYGASTTTGGGFALKHVTTHKLKFGRTGTPPYVLKLPVPGSDKPEAVKVGHELSITVERNKVAPPGRTATINLMNQTSEKYGPRGLDRVDEAVTLGLMKKIIKQRGGWYDTPDGQSFNGRPALVEGVRKTGGLADIIRKEALDQMADAIVVGQDAPDIEAVDELIDSLSDEETLETAKLLVDNAEEVKTGNKGIADLAREAQANLEANLSS